MIAAALIPLILAANAAPTNPKRGLFDIFEDELQSFASVTSQAGNVKSTAAVSKTSTQHATTSVSTASVSTASASSTSQSADWFSFTVGAGTVSTVPAATSGAPIDGTFTIENRRSYYGDLDDDEDSAASQMASQLGLPAMTLVEQATTTVTKPHIRPTTSFSSTKNINSRGLGDMMSELAAKVSADAQSEVAQATAAVTSWRTASASASVSTADILHGGLGGMMSEMASKMSKDVQSAAAQATSTVGAVKQHTTMSASITSSSATSTSITTQATWLSFTFGGSASAAPAATSGALLDGGLTIESKRGIWDPITSKVAVTIASSVVQSKPTSSTQGGDLGGAWAWAESVLSSQIGSQYAQATSSIAAHQHPHAPAPAPTVVPSYQKRGLWDGIGSEVGSDVEATSTSCPIPTATPQVGSPSYDADESAVSSYVACMRAAKIQTTGTTAAPSASTATINERGIGDTWTSMTAGWSPELAQASPTAFVTYSRYTDVPPPFAPTATINARGLFDGISSAFGDLSAQATAAASQAAQGASNGGSKAGEGRVDGEYPPQPVTSGSGDGWSRDPWCASVGGRLAGAGGNVAKCQG